MDTKSDQDPIPATFSVDYDTSCIYCGSSPTVIVAGITSKQSYHSTLCGPCFFGEAEMVDPENWNE